MKYESQLQITTAAAVPPLTVNQTALVTNFNADLLDGQHGAYYATAASLSGYLPLTGGTLTGTLTGTIGVFTTVRATELTSLLGSNGPITITPDGTGHVHINSTDIRLGPNNTNATLATRGTGDLILRTNEGSAVEGFIRIFDGANGNIEITPNGTGTVVVGKLSGSTASFSGAVTSTVATGTAPLVVASTTAVANLNADLLDGQHGSYYQNAGNLNAGIVPLARLSGSYNIDITGSSAFVFVNDTRSSVTGPQTGYRQVRADFLNNSTDGLSDGGTYHGVLTFQQWADSSGGGTRQLAFTDNDNLWIRGSGTGLTAYNPWKLVLNSVNYSTYALPLSGGTLTGQLFSNSKIETTGVVTGSSFSGAGTGLTGTAASLTAGAVPWTGVTGKPTTLSGYGITDALPLTGGTLTGGLSGTTASFSGAVSAPQYAWASSKGYETSNSEYSGPRTLFELAYALAQAHGSNDTFRYKTVLNRQSWNGSAWVTDNSTAWTNTLTPDGGGTTVITQAEYAAGTTKKRFTIDVGGDWQRANLIFVQRGWNQSDWAFSLEVERSTDNVNWTSDGVQSVPNGPGLAYFSQADTGQTRWFRITVAATQVITAGGLTIIRVMALGPRYATVHPFTVDYSRNVSFAAGITIANPITSTVATGTAPLVITSTTAVTNLNSDLLDGQHGSYFEGRDTTAAGFSGGTLTLTRATGNLTVSLDGRYLPLSGGTLTGGLTGTSLTLSSLATLVNSAGTNYNENVRFPRATSGYVSLALACDTSGSGSIAGQFNIIVYPAATSGGAFAIRANGTDALTMTTAGAVNIPTLSGTTGSFSGQITSTVATGTAPLVIASTTLVSNLNAQYLNGQLGSYYQNASNLNAGTVPAAQMPAHTGDVTSTAGSVALTIANDTVTNAKLKTMGAGTIKGNNGAVANSPSDLTAAQVATMLSGQTMNIAGSSTSCTGNAASASSVPWSGITSKPTTLSGYGITDALSSTINQQGGKPYTVHDFNTYPLLYDVTFVNPTGSTNLPTGMAAVMSYRFIMGAGDTATRGFDLVGAAEGSGNLYIRERSIGTWSRVLHSNNYNSYAPTLTGTGASGSWGISVTGSSASCTGSAAQLNGQAASYYLNASNLNAGTVPAAQMPAHTGDVTSTAGSVALTIANDTVTNAKLKTMGASTIKGNNGGVANSPSDLTPAQVATMLSGQTMNIAGSSTSCTGNSATATTSTRLSDATNGLRIANPGGGSYATGASTATGAIKIKLPTASFKSNTMFRFTVKIYQYAGGASGLSRTIEIGGYNYSDAAASWYNYFAYQNTMGGGELNVRFGNDGTSQCVWIGEIATVWDYPQVTVTDFQGGYSNYTDAIWSTGWVVTFATAFDTVTQGPIVAAKPINSQNYSSYALPLTGGTISGVVRINSQLQVGQNTNGTAYIDAYGGYAWFGRDSNSTGIRIDGSANVHLTNTLNVVGAITQNGNQVVHAGNVSSYALPIGGGTLTGQLTIATGGATGLRVNSPSGTQGFWLRVGYDTDGTATPVASALNTMLQSSGSSAGTFTIVCGNDRVATLSNAAANFAVALQQGGNQVIHAGNYTSYPPARWATARTISLTGDVTGTSGGFDGTANLSFAATIANSAVTYAKIQNVAVSSVLGNSSASVAQAPAALSMATLAGMLSGQTMNIAGSSTSCTGNAATATNVAWSGITSKPTTLGGFGITDAFSSSGGAITGAVSIVGQTINGQSHYQWEGATYRNPGDWIATLIARRDNSTAGINGSIPALVLYNNNGGDQTTVGLSFASAEGATGQGNAVTLAGIVARKEGAGSVGAWSSGSLNFYVKNSSARVDAINISSTGTVNALVALQQGGNQVLHAGNVSTYALPIGGGTLTGTLTAPTLQLSNGFQIQQGASNYGQFNTWVHLNGSYGFYSGVNSAHLYPNNGSYGSWRMDGSRNGWGGIEFGNGVSLMMGSDTVGFHQNTNGWLFRVHNGTGFIHKGSWGGGTTATIFDSENYTAYLNNTYLRAAGHPGYGDWNTFGNTAQTVHQMFQENFNLPTSTGSSNFPTNASYKYGTLINFGTGSDARAQVYISHAGNDLVFRGGWGTAGWNTWNRCVTDVNFPSFGTHQASIGNSLPTTVFMSTDANIRQAPFATAKAHLGITSKWANSRPNLTGDSNYWTGVMGWGTTDWNSIFDWGSGFTDSWSSPANNPGDSSHHTGIQVVHYTNGSSRYGWQIVGGAGNNRLWLRSVWGGSFTSWYELLHGGNYNNYAPTLTGTGASGTWGISITGNAATATNGFTVKPGWAGNQNLILEISNFNNSLPSGFYQGYQATNSPTATWYNLINVRHSNTGNDHGFQLAMSYYDEVLWSRTYSGGTGANNGTFTTWRAHLHSGNYNSYAPTLTGGGASGSWGINITGSSASCTGNAATCTTANGIADGTVSTTAKLANSVVTYAKIQNVTAYTVLGNSSPSASQAPVEINMASLASMLSGNTMNISGSSTSCSGNAATASAVAASGITGQTGMWTSAARPGPYRLYRRDANDAYSVQNYWTGTYWRLDGYYSNDTVHAGCSVAYADTAGSASSATNASQLNGQAGSYYENRSPTAVSISAGTLTLTRAAGNLTTTIGGRVVAWCDFNGNFASTQTPNANFNVSSITKNATGDYTVNFSSALANANYVVAGSAQLDAPSPGQSTYNVMVAVPRRSGAKATGSCRIVTEYPLGVTLYDSVSVGVAFIAA